MNHQLGDYCHVNHDNNDNIAQNTSRKRRAIENAIPSPTSQASTSNANPHVPIISAQPKVANQQKKNTSNRRHDEPLVDPCHVSIPIVSKVVVKPLSTSLNIVEKMKKTNVRIPKWNFLTIPS